MPTLAEYFTQPDAERVLLVEVVRNNANNTVYYFGDNDYISEPSDTPANTPYTPIIGGTGIGDIRKTLNDPFTGQASTGFGSITLIDNYAWAKDGATTEEQKIVLRRGAEVTAWIAGPAGDYARTDAIQILKGKIGRTGGDSSGNVNFEVLDGSQEVYDKPITVTTKPLCFGYCRNITPFLTNPSNLEYHVHDGQIEEVVAVYDQGVLLTLTTDYTVDLTTGKITLVSSPVGVITADIKGAKPSGTWLDSTQEIAAELISRAGITITQTYNIPTGVVGIYVERTTALGDLLNQLMAGVAGYWLIDSNNEFSAAQYPVPGETTTIAAYDSNELLSEVQIADEDRVYNRIRYSYRKNWSQYQSLPGATTAQADFSQKPYIESSEAAVSPDTEIVYQESPLIETLFDLQSDAQSVAQRLLSIYDSQRRMYTVDIPYINGLDLGNNITIEFGIDTITGSIVSIVDIFDGGYPTQRIQILA